MSDTQRTTIDVRSLKLDEVDVFLELRLKLDSETTLMMLELGERHEMLDRQRLEIAAAV